jgi:catechol 2,3-dioxygenase-like lactoylglutathione lyase family enzyme
VLDHVSIPVRDVEASVRFYLDVFAALGLREALRYERDGLPVVGLSGPDGFPHFWLGTATGAPVRRGPSSQNGALWRYFDGGNAPAVQRDEATTVPGAKHAGILRQDGDGMVDDLVSADRVGLVIGDVDVVTTDEPDAQDNSSHGRSH